MRLTYELGHKGSKEYDTDNRNDMPINNIYKAINKLGQLEDIEEELGIDLKVYHKLLDMLYCDEPNIVYVKYKNKIIQLSILYIDYGRKKIFFSQDKNYNAFYYYGFEDYGKDWSLDKNELGGN